MRRGRKTSSAIFADFTMSRVPQEVRSSLTDEQYNAIHAALVAQNDYSRHQVDIRLRIPFFFRHYYIVFFAGRDRRATTYRLEYIRLTQVPKPVQRIFYLLVSFSLIAAFVTMIFAIAYKLKSLMGIDIFPEFHLNDLLSIDSYLLNRMWG